jgi:glycosyltransferase involved in cell wall biosynthesis
VPDRSLPTRKNGEDSEVTDYDRGVRVSLIDPVSYTLPYDTSLASALARRGHEVDLIAAAFAHGAAPEPVGFRRHDLFFTVSARLLARRPRSRARFAVKGLEYLPDLVRADREITHLDPEIVHVQWLGIPDVDRLWLRRLARRRGLIFTAHDVLPRRTERRLELWRTIFAAVDRVVVHGAAAVERLTELGVPPERIARIPHPLFTGPADELRPPNGRTLLHFGFLRSTKGLDILLRALPGIAAEVPDVRLVVAGDPLEPVDGLERLASELGVAPYVEWRLGYVADAEIPGLLEQATAVVLPYRKIESSGVLATALGHGRPAVVSDVGSLGETVREFGAGLVVPPEDPAALAAACVRLLLDARTREDAFRGTERARRALSWDAAAEAHERLYADVLRDRLLRTA